MTARAAAWLLFLAALGLGLAGAYLVAIFVAIAAALVEITAPTPAQMAARRRARPPKYFQARPVSRR